MKVILSSSRNSCTRKKRERETRDSLVRSFLPFLRSSQWFTLTVNWCHVFLLCLGLFASSILFLFHQMPHTSSCNLSDTRLMNRCIFSRNFLCPSPVEEESKEKQSSICKKQSNSCLLTRLSLFLCFISLYFFSSLLLSTFLLILWHLHSPAPFSLTPFPHPHPPSLSTLVICWPSFPPDVSRLARFKLIKRKCSTHHQWERKAGRQAHIS